MSFPCLDVPHHTLTLSAPRHSATAHQHRSSNCLCPALIHSIEPCRQRCQVSTPPYYPSAIPTPPKTYFCVCLRSGSPLDPACDPSAHKLSADAPHYLVIDTNVALHQVRLMLEGFSSFVRVCSEGGGKAMLFSSKQQQTKQTAIVAEGSLVGMQCRDLLPFVDI